MVTITNTGMNRKISMSLSKCEVLSPAGSLESLYAAVRSGADAVYLGAKRFSARRNAENFDDEQLKEAIKYCKIRGVKVYLAVNILIKESEISDAVATVRSAYENGLDGVIVQDLGLCRILRELFPKLELHASTQMTVYSPAPLKKLKKLGISRVVAAREMSKGELKKLCFEAEQLDMEVEVFVHGALCMSVSGQCLLSAIIGTRSGNRGLCAGPCRLPFKVSSGTGFDLSLKDLSLIEHIPELIEMGVKSLKIEGRMKRPEYIAAATASCRLAADGMPIPRELSAALSDVFTRSGFTDGYYTEKKGADMFGVRTKEEAVLSKSAFSYLHSLYRNERSSIPVDISFEAQRGGNISLFMSDGERSIRVLGEAPSEAISRETTLDDAEKLLKKLGGTPYYARSVSAKIENGLFIAGSQLSDLRRRAVEALNGERGRVPAEKYPEYEFKAQSVNRSSTGEGLLYARFSRVDQIPEDLSGIHTVILPLEICHSVDLKLPEGVRPAIELPRWIAEEDLTVKQLFKLKGKGFKTAYCATLAAAVVAERAGLEIIGAVGLNVYNSLSAGVLSKSFGVSEITLSPELTVSEAEGLSIPTKKGIFAYGRLPLMLFKNCPVRSFSGCKKCKGNGFATDRRGARFDIACRGTESELLNCLPISLSDKIQELSQLDFFILYFTVETPSNAADIINSYKAGNRLEGEFTRGLYYRRTL